MVIDVTLIGDTFDLDLAHARKVQYYNTGIIRNWCSRESGVPPNDVQFSACVLNWRGLPSTRSMKELRTVGIRKRAWQTLSVRTLDGGCRILNTTIIADNFDPNDAHERKCMYYDQPTIRKWCGESSGRPPDDIIFSACAFNWRGTPATRTTRDLANYFGITNNDFCQMSIRTLEQGVRINNAFHRTTTNYRNSRRQGVAT